MLDFLFPRLTRTPDRGQALFDRLSDAARRPHWYVEGKVPDTIDGRFRVLATLIALAAVRLESGGGDGDAASVALTERFVAVMEAEHREIGLGDPALGRKVRKLVGSLAKRVELWRQAASGQRAWTESGRDSLYRQYVEEADLEHSAQALKRYWSTLEANGIDAIAAGEFQ